MYFAIGDVFILVLLFGGVVAAASQYLSHLFGGVVAAASVHLYLLFGSVVAVALLF